MPCPWGAAITQIQEMPASYAMLEFQQRSLLHPAEGSLDKSRHKVGFIIMFLRRVRPILGRTHKTCFC